MENFPKVLKIFVQVIALAFSLAAFSAGRSMPAMIAIMAIVTRSSMRVNDVFFLFISTSFPFNKIDVCSRAREEIGKGIRISRNNPAFKNFRNPFRLKRKTYFPLSTACAMNRKKLP